MWKRAILLSVRTDGCQIAKQQRKPSDFPVRRIGQDACGCKRPLQRVEQTQKPMKGRPHRSDRKSVFQPK